MDNQKGDVLGCLFIQSFMVPNKYDYSVNSLLWVAAGRKSFDFNPQWCSYEDFVKEKNISFDLKTGVSE